VALPTKLTLRIVSPDQAISHEVDEVSLPGVEGDFGVLPGHTPFFTALRTGPMWYRQGGERHSLIVSIGFVEVLPDSVTVISQVAERAEDLDQERAEAGMKRAEEMMGAVPHEIDFERARLELLRTLQQLAAESRKYQ
jgi:F-type H+-transporting ATPase subunit epsilon